MGARVANSDSVPTVSIMAYEPRQTREVHVQQSVMKLNVSISSEHTTCHFHLSDRLHTVTSSENHRHEHVQAQTPRVQRNRMRTLRNVCNKVEVS
jgi:hypothetical protein